MKNKKGLEHLVQEKVEKLESKDFYDIIYEIKQKYFPRTPRREIENSYVGLRLSAFLTTISSIKPELFWIELPTALYNFYLGNKFDRMEEKTINNEHNNRYKKNFLKGAFIGAIVGFASAYLQNKFNIKADYLITSIQYAIAGGTLLGTFSIRNSNIVKDYITFFNE